MCQRREPRRLGYSVGSGCGDGYLAVFVRERDRRVVGYGGWTARHAYDFLLNGEFCGNGNDHVYLSRLRTSGVCSPEFFSPALKSLSGCYRGAGRFLRNARSCGKRFGVTVETSRGGGGAQPYWSARTGYALCYFLSALGFDGFEYDGIPGHSSWAEYASGRNAFNIAELNLGMVDARGYRQATLDGAYRAYRLIAGREEVFRAQDGYLKLALGDDFTDVFYYGADDTAYRAFLEKVKTERTLTADFFGPAAVCGYRMRLTATGSSPVECR